MKDKNHFMENREKDFTDSISIQDTMNTEDEMFDDVIESLKRQVSEELDDHLEGSGNSMGTNWDKKKRRKKRRVLKIVLGFSIAILLVLLYLVGTKSGRQKVYGFLGNYLAGNMNVETNTEDETEAFSNSAWMDDDSNVDPSLRQEDYVKNYLIMGIENVVGGERTDSMMLVSINTKDDSIKLSSLLRDTYVSIPGYKYSKLNAAFGKGGADLLIDTIEQNYKIKIRGYASVNFESFEKIIDRLGGIDIELGAKEANYLNTTNYISNPAYRNVKEGWNTLNGNQALGYCRVRKVETLGGANSDYGRTLRQRRVLSAIFDKYKSSSIFDLVPITEDCLQYITTDLDSREISKVIETIFEEGITTMDQERFPMDGLYTSERNEAGAVLVPDWDANIQELYKFIFLDGVDTQTEGMESGTTQTESNTTQTDSNN